MSREPINHPAFPVPPYEGDKINPPIRSNSGMSMRDYFATAAMAKLINDKTISEPDNVAEDAYAFADAMLEERSYSTRK